MYNVQLIFREKKIFNMSIVSFYQYLLTSKNAKIEEEKLVLVLFVLGLDRRPCTVPRVLNNAKILLIPLGIGSSKLGKKLHHLVEA